MRQEVLTQIADAAVAVIRQGKRSMAMVDGDWQCAYRGEYGAKCFAGHLIKDEFYCPDLEGYRVTSDSVMASLRHSLGVDHIEPEAVSIVSVLQLWHDGTGAFVKHADRLTLEGLSKLRWKCATTTELIELVKEKLE